MRISTATSDIHKSADYHCIVTTIVGYLYLGTRGICGSDAVQSSEWGYITVTQYSSTWYCWDVCTLLITLLKWAVSSRDESSVTTWSDREEKEVKEERERDGWGRKRGRQGGRERGKARYGWLVQRQLFQQGLDVMLTPTYHLVPDVFMFGLQQQPQVEEQTAALASMITRAAMLAWGRPVIITQLTNTFYRLIFSQYLYM